MMLIIFMIFSDELWDDILAFYNMVAFLALWFGTVFRHRHVSKSRTTQMQFWFELLHNCTSELTHQHKHTECVGVAAQQRPSTHGCPTMIHPRTSNESRPTNFRSTAQETDGKLILGPGQALCSSRMYWIGPAVEWWDKRKAHITSFHKQPKESLCVEQDRERSVKNNSCVCRGSYDN